jgi:hypothetical protein
LYIFAVEMPTSVATKAKMAKMAKMANGQNGIRISSSYPVNNSSRMNIFEAS